MKEELQKLRINVKDCLDRIKFREIIYNLKVFVDEEKTPEENGQKKKIDILRK